MTSASFLTSSKRLLPFPGEQHASHIWVSREVLEHGFEFRPHRLEEGIQFLGPVDLDVGDVLRGGCDGEVFKCGEGRHGVCVGWRRGWERDGKGG